MWTGTYDCSSGLTGVRLTITGPNGGALMATVDFYPVSTNPGVAEGSYELVGRYSRTDGLVLNPDYWIDEPAGYKMVGLSAPPPHGDSIERLRARPRLLDLLGDQVGAGRENVRR